MLIVLLFHFFDPGEAHHVALLVVEPALQVLDGQFGSQLHPEEVDLEHHHVAVIVLGEEHLPCGTFGPDIGCE